MTPQEYEAKKRIVLDELADSEAHKELDPLRRCMYFHALTSPFQNDKEVMLTSLINYPDCVLNASKRLYSDKEFVLAVVGESGSNLQSASVALRNDIEVVETACGDIGLYSYCFQFASKRIRSSPKLVARCCESSFSPLTYIHDSMKNDKRKLLLLIRELEDSQKTRVTGQQITLSSSISREVIENASESIKKLVGDGDPVEVLTKAVASEKLAAKLSNQLRPRIEPRQQSMKI